MLSFPLPLSSGRGGKNEFMPPGKRDKLKPEEIALI
jgi:hypothetical protein